MNVPPHFQTSCGLAYSGNSFVGLNLATTLPALTMQLRSLIHLGYPSLEDVAEITRRIVSKYQATMLDATRKPESFSSIIAGYCHKERKFKCFRIDSQFDPPGATLKTEPIDDPYHVVVLGSRIKEVEEALRLARANTDPIKKSPATVIKKILQNKQFPDIGGDLQIGAAYEEGFVVYADWAPVDNPRRDDTLKFRGLDLFEDVTVMVGSLMIAPPGMP